MQGLDALRRHEVDDILCTLNGQRRPLRWRSTASFAMSLGAQFIQFIPIIERVEPEQIDAALATGIQLHAGEVAAVSPAWDIMARPTALHPDRHSGHRPLDPA